MGIGIAVPVAIKESGYAMAPFGADYETFKLPGLVFVAGVMVLLYVMSLRKEPPAGPSGGKDFPKAKINDD